MKETIKSLVLVVLVIMNFILGSQVLSTQKLWPDNGYNFFVSMKTSSLFGFFGNLFSIRDKSDHETHLEAPMQIIVNTGYQTSRRVLYNTDTAFDETLAITNDYLSAAFAKHQPFTEVSRGEFHSVLTSRSVFLRYPTDYDTALFSYFLGAGTPDSSLGFSQLKNLAISSDGDVYVEDSSNGRIYRYQTGLPTVSLINFIDNVNETATGDSVINYAFDLGFDKGFATQKTILSPTIPIYADSFDVETVICNNVLLNQSGAPNEHIISDILPLFNMNPNGFRRYTEVDGTVVYVENNAVLKVTTDGYINYQAKDDGILLSALLPPTPNDSVASVATFVDKVNSAAKLDSSMQLSSKLTAEELSGDTLTVTLDYVTNGRLVKFPDRSAVTLTITNGRITEYKHSLFSFEKSGRYVYVDNYIDALDSAITEFQSQINDIEIDKMDICYYLTKTDGEILPDWYVEVKEIVIE